MRHLSYPVFLLSALVLGCGQQDPAGTLEPPAAAFSEVSECQAQIAQLRESTTVTTTFTSEKDRAGLLGKLDGAVKSLNAGKNGDVAQKLTDFGNKVTSLQVQGKIGPEATQLISDAQSAISCISSL